MSFAWSFYTVSGPKFEDHFLGAHPDKLEVLDGALRWDEGALDDEAILFVARHLATEGLSYRGLDEEEASLLDECISILVSEEGLGEALERNPESPDFVHPSIIDTLLAAAGQSNVPAKLLPILQSGRRYGSANPTPDCNYCVLSSNEAAELAAELTAIVAATPSWGKETWMPELVTECLVGPLTQSVQKQRPLLGLLG